VVVVDVLGSVVADSLRFVGLTTGAVVGVVPPFEACSVGIAGAAVAGVVVGAPGNVVVVDC
jgi:hypothetical protein